MFKNCAPFTDCISEVNNTQDVVMSMYNLIEYIDNYSRISRSLRQYYGDESNTTLTNLDSSKSKARIPYKMSKNTKQRYPCCLKYKGC